MSVSTDPILTPRSVRHIPLPQHSPTSPSQHLSMMEILSLQEAEKTSIRDAAAKRSLQEIQQEQEFQQWWDQESRRVIEEEAQTKRLLDRAAKSAARGRGSKGRGGRGGKAKGQEKKVGVDEADCSKGKNDGNVGQYATAPKTNISKAASKHDNGGRAPGQENAGRGGRGRIGRGGRVGGRGGRSQGPSRDGVATSVQQGQAPAS